MHAIGQLPSFYLLESIYFMSRNLGRPEKG